MIARTQPMLNPRARWRDGYKRRRWDSLRERWNEEHPGHRFETYNQFHKYFTRGDKAVKGLNFSWPRPNEEDT